MAHAISFEDRLTFENRVKRHALFLLSPAETKVLLYILDRTLGWNKDRETITHRELEHGKKNCSFGAGVTAKTARRCIKALCDIGLIQVITSTRKHATKIVVNLKWRFEEMLKRPTQHREKAKTKLGESLPPVEKDDKDEVVSTPRWGSEYPTGEVVSTPPIKEKERNFSKEKDWAQAPDRMQPVSNSLSAEEAITAGKTRNAAARVKRRARAEKSADAGRVTITMLERSWDDGTRDRCGQIAKVWTGKERGQAKHLLNAVRLEGRQLLAFMYFCSNEWPIIIRSQFKWAAGELESMPNIGFMLKYANGFLHAFNNQEAMRKEATLPPTEQWVQRLVRTKGLSEDEAREEIEERHRHRKSRKRQPTPQNPNHDAFLEHVKSNRPSRPLPVAEKAPLDWSEPERPLQLDPLPEWK